MQEELIIDQHRRSMPLSLEEQEENILRYLYNIWQKGGEMTKSSLEKAMNIEQDSLQECLEEMVVQGYIDKNNDNVFLTTFGKEKGAEYARRHNGLTQFIQTICNVNEEEARENACRVEHVISKKVVQGIYDFIQYGSTYEREVTNANLALKYKVGTYLFVMDIYKPERRFPRERSNENIFFLNEIEFKVTKEKSYFYMYKKNAYKKNIWYLLNGEWRLAKEEKKSVQIPSEAFRFSVDVNEPIIEGKALIAFSTSYTVPRSDYRELSVHMW